MPILSYVRSRAIVALDERPFGLRLKPLAEAIAVPLSSVQEAMQELIETGVIERITDLGRPVYRANPQEPWSHLAVIASWSLGAATATEIRHRANEIDGSTPIGRGAAARCSQIVEGLATSPAARRWLPTIVERIVIAFDPVRIVLFGSQAKGQARWDSDVDLMIMLDSAESRRKTAIAVMHEVNGIPLAKDVVITTPDRIIDPTTIVGTIVKTAISEGVTLYEREAIGV
jgi:predicted nucleotidyltransferase